MALHLPVKGIFCESFIKPLISAHDQCSDSANAKQKQSGRLGDCNNTKSNITVFI